MSSEDLTRMKPAVDEFATTVLDAIASIVKLSGIIGLIPYYGPRLIGANSGMTRRRKRELVARLRR